MRKYKYEGYGVVRDTEIDFPYHTDDIVELLDEKDQNIANLEAKLAEKDEQIKRRIAVYEKQFIEQTNENCELKQQLAEKEKRCEICGSKMILGELGYYCNNDELHPIYQTPNEAKSDYEKITLLKQDYDAMVEREELLRQQLEEKEKEIKTILKENEELVIKHNVYNWGDKIQQDKVYSVTGEALELLINRQNKLAIEQLEKVKEFVNEIYGEYSASVTTNFIDNQINELKGKVEDVKD